MPFEDWSSFQLRALLIANGFRIPEGTTRSELRDFALEHFGAKALESSNFDRDESSDFGILGGRLGILGGNRLDQGMLDGEGGRGGSTTARYSSRSEFPSAKPNVMESSDFGILRGRLGILEDSRLEQGIPDGEVGRGGSTTARYSSRNARESSNVERDMMESSDFGIFGGRQGIPGGGLEQRMLGGEGGREGSKTSRSAEELSNFNPNELSDFGILGGRRGVLSGVGGRLEQRVSVDERAGPRTAQYSNVDDRLTGDRTSRSGLSQNTMIEERAGARAAQRSNVNNKFSTSGFGADADKSAQQYRGAPQTKLSAAEQQRISVRNAGSDLRSSGSNANVDKRKTNNRPRPLPIGGDDIQIPITLARRASLDDLDSVVTIQTKRGSRATTGSSLDLSEVPTVPITSTPRGSLSSQSGNLRRASELSLPGHRGSRVVARPSLVENMITEIDDEPTVFAIETRSLEIQPQDQVMRKPRGTAGRLMQNPPSRSSFVENILPFKHHHHPEEEDLPTVMAVVMDQDDDEEKQSEPLPNQTKLRRESLAGIVVDSSIVFENDLTKAELAKLTKEMKTQHEEDSDVVIEGWDEARFDVEFGEADSFSKPSIETARRYAALHHPVRVRLCGSRTGRHCFRGGPLGAGFDCLQEGSVSEMARYGTGMSLHFKNIKFLFWMFVFATCLTLPELFLNSQNTSWSGGSLFGTTVGNLFAYSNSTFTFLCPSSVFSQNATISSFVFCDYTLAQLAPLYTYIDVVLIFLFAFGLIWLSYFVSKESDQVARLFLSLDRYSVIVENLPQGCGERPLAQYFQTQTGEAVDEVNIAYDDGELISLFMERGEVLSVMWRIAGRVLMLYQAEEKSSILLNEDETQSIKAEKLERLVDYFDLLLTTYHSINEQTKSIRGNGAPLAVVGIVTFMHHRGALKALEMFHHRKLKSSKDLPAISDFQGAFLHCRQAPPPSTILWENLEFGYRARFSRQFIAFFLVFLAIFMSFSASFGAQLYREELLTFSAEQCHNETEAWFSGLNQTIALSPDDELSCMCSKYTFARASSAIFAPIDPCHLFWVDRAPLFAFTIFATIVVSLVNFVVGYLMERLARFERHHSILDKELSVALRLFVAYAINIGFVYVFVNIVLLGIEANDLTADWYANVGVQLLIIFIVNIFAPHVTILYDFLASVYLRRFGDDPLLQRELNERYVGKEFPFAMRSAQILVQAWLTLLFGPGIPLLYLISTISFALFYVVDKWCVLRLYRTPPEYDSRISRRLVFILWLGLIGHVCFAIWAYSSPGLFAPLPRDDVAPTFMTMTTSSFIERVFQANVFPLIIVGWLVVVMFILSTFASSLCVCLRSCRSRMGCCQRRSAEVVAKRFSGGGGGANAVIQSIKGLSGNTDKSSFPTVSASAVAGAGGESFADLKNVPNDARSEHSEPKDDLPPLYVAKQSGYLRGLRSYNLLQNPVYRRAFNVPKTFCDEHSHVHSVLALSGSDVLPEIPEEIRAFIEQY